MHENNEHLVLDSTDSPARVLWVDTLLRLFTPPKKALPEHLNEEAAHEVRLHWAHCEVACDMYATEYSPLDVFTHWDELSRHVHLKEIHRIRDFVSSMDTTGYDEQEQQAHEKAMKIMEEVIDYAENGREEGDETLFSWEQE
ncbi:hypothetical protein [Blastopirellula marina]|uniref:Uncharacterized protein n=1 Tax=Blastopirellula marina TaxID=124 RepID=A0A2S8GLL0_9BACT|nr:hypothetical protein [Blastopirellula marina]PQO45315.1 hypothetical protein C5Y93_15290 [Blastopirellula marina]